MGQVKIPAPALAVSAMLAIQLGAALSTHLFDALTPAGAAWLRLSIAAALLMAITRPAIRSIPRRTLLSTVLLGTATGLMTLMFMEAIARIPLGTAVAIEFLGPLGVAAIRSHRRLALIWPALGLVGVVGLTQPWLGELDVAGLLFALAAAVGWGSYIMLTHRVGSQLDGFGGLAISLSVGAVVIAPFGIANAVGGLTPTLAAQSLGLAILVPLLPFTLELLALRRMPIAAFGTLMALEPGIATVLGLAILTQIPNPLQIAGIVLVISAGIGAQQANTSMERQTPGKNSRNEGLEPLFP